MARQLRLSLEHRDPPSFDDFVRGASNADALTAVQAWPAWRGGCLALIGPEGSGKSHLGQAWARATGALVLEAGAADIAATEGRPVLVEDADAVPAAENLFHLINLAARPGGGLLLTGRTRPAAW